MTITLIILTANYLYHNHHIDGKRRAGDGTRGAEQRALHSQAGHSHSGQGGPFF